MRTLDIEKISRMLITLRKQKNFNQEEMADALNVSERTVRRWESGESLPSMDDIVNICNVFNLSLEEVFEGNGKFDKDMKSRIDQVSYDLGEINSRLSSTEQSIINIDSRIKDILISIRNNEIKAKRKEVKTLSVCCLTLIPLTIFMYFMHWVFVWPVLLVLIVYLVFIRAYAMEVLEAIVNSDNDEKKS